MRQSDREIQGRSEIEDIIATALVCRLAFSDDGAPYVVPMNFGYRDGILYFHSAPFGRKIDIIKRNSRVCFEIDIDHEVIESDEPCGWSMRYRSVIGFGRAALVENDEEKRAALAAIVEHYAHRLFEVTAEDSRDVAVIKVTIDEMTGKR